MTIAAPLPSLKLFILLSENRIKTYYYYNTITFQELFITLTLSSDCCNKYHRLRGLSNRNLILRVLEAGSLSPGCPHD